MARPKEAGLDYYPQDTDIHNDRKIRRLRKEYCGNGYMVYDYIKCLIYKENGYWIDINEELIFDVADFLGCGITIEFVTQVIEFCFLINLFHRVKYNELGVLTSSGIQKRYLKVKRNWVIATEMLVSAAETGVIAAETPINLQKPKKDAKKEVKKTGKKSKSEIIKTAETPVIAAETPVIAAETPVIAVETPVIAVESTQSKVKESKVNNNSNTIIKKSDEELEFEHMCNVYKGKWYLTTKPAICAHFFFADSNFDFIRDECYKVLSLYYVMTDKESGIMALKKWAKEFVSYLKQTNKEKSMEGPDGFPFHFKNWLRNKGALLKSLPANGISKEVVKEKTADELLTKRR